MPLPHQPLHTKAVPGRRAANVAETYLLAKKTTCDLMKKKTPNKAPSIYISQRGRVCQMAAQLFDGKNVHLGGFPGFPILGMTTD